MPLEMWSCKATGSEVLGSVQLGVKGPVPSVVGERGLMCGEAERRRVQVVRNIHEKDVFVISHRHSWVETPA